MISLEAIVAVKALVCLGFALWLLVSVVNHFTDWSGAVTAVGGFMRMASFDQEPKIPSPLTRRRIQSRAVHVTTFAVIVAIQAIDALLLAVAGLSSWPAPRSPCCCQYGVSCCLRRCGSRSSSPDHGSAIGSGWAICSARTCCCSLSGCSRW